MRSRRLRSLFVFCALSALTAPLLVSDRAGAAPADPGSAAAATRFVGLINEFRAANSLPGLAPNAELQAIAAGWAEQMPTLVQCRDGVLLPHNPGFVPPTGRMPPALQVNFRLLKENVGCATTSDVDGLHQAFLNSPNHRMNILDPHINAMGLAVFVAADGGMWVVEDFGDLDPRPAPVATAPASPDRLALRTGVRARTAARVRRSKRS